MPIGSYIVTGSGYATVGQTTSNFTSSADNPFSGPTGVIRLPDNVMSIATNLDSSSFGKYSDFIAGSNFGFSIPVGSTITGMSLIIYAATASGGANNDIGTDAVVIGPDVGNVNTAFPSLTPGQNLPTGITKITFVVPASTVAQLTPAIVNGTGFFGGASFQNNLGTPARGVYVDSIAMSVDYTLLQNVPFYKTSSVARCGSQLMKF